MNVYLFIKISFILISIYLMLKDNITNAYFKYKSIIINGMIYILAFVMIILIVIMVAQIDLGENWESINIPLLSIIIGFFTQILLYKRNDLRSEKAYSLSLLLDISHKISCIQHVYKKSRNDKVNQFIFTPLETLINIENLNTYIEKLDNLFSTDELITLNVFYTNYKIFIEDSIIKKHKQIQEIGSKVVEIDSSYDMNIFIREQGDTSIHRILKDNYKITLPKADKKYIQAFIEIGFFKNNMDMFYTESVYEDNKNLKSILNKLYFVSDGYKSRFKLIDISSSIEELMEETR